MTVDGDRAGIDIVKAEQQLETRRFSTTRLADNGSLGTRRYRKIDAFDCRIAILVGELDVVEAHLSARFIQTDRIGLLDDARGFLELIRVSIRVTVTRRNRIFELTRSSMRSASIRLFCSMV